MKNDLTMLRRLVALLAFGLWLLSGPSHVYASDSANQFHGILPPAAPGPYYVLPFDMSVTGFNRQRSYYLLPRWRHRQIDQQPPPYYSDQDYRSNYIPVGDKTDITNQLN